MLIIVKPSRSSPRKRATRPRKNRADALLLSVVVDMVLLELYWLFVMFLLQY